MKFLLPVPSNNVIMQELMKKNVKVLSEKVLLLLNRGGRRRIIQTPSPYIFIFLCFYEPSLSHVPSPLPRQMTLCVYSNTPHLPRILCSSSCRTCSPAGSQQTSSIALTWWWWLTSPSDKYLTSHPETRWARLYTPDHPVLHCTFSTTYIQHLRRSNTPILHLKSVATCLSPLMIYVSTTWVQTLFMAATSLVKQVTEPPSPWAHNLTCSTCTSPCVEWLI